MHHLALGERVLLTTDLYIANVARHAEGDEHHKVVPVEQTLALGGHRFNLDALKER
jgi:hypothetical protein